MTFRDLLKDSMKLIGALAVGEAPSADDLSDGMTLYNAMIGSWSNENLLIFSKDTQDFVLVPGQSLYTMGTGANFDAARPAGVDAVKVFDGNTECPIKVITQEQWEFIQLKDTQSPLPTKVWINTKFPNIELNFWPVPNAGKTLRIYSWHGLAKVTTANDLLSFPDGYYLAFMYNFAILLSTPYGKSVTPEVASVATESKAAIKRKNVKRRLVRTDIGIARGRKFNIYGGS